MIFLTCFFCPCCFYFFFFFFLFYVVFFFFFFFSSRRRHTRSLCDWSSDVCSSDLSRGVPDLARDPAVRPHLASRDLERLVEHLLRERRQAAEVEPQAPLPAQLVLDPARKVGRRFDTHELAPDVAQEPILELGRGLAPHRGRDAEPVPGHVDRAQDRLEHRVRVGHPGLREHALGKSGRRLHVAKPLQVNHHRRHGFLL